MQRTHARARTAAQTRSIHNRCACVFAPATHATVIKPMPCCALRAPTATAAVQGGPYPERKQSACLGWVDAAIAYQLVHEGSPDIDSGTDRAKQSRQANQCSQGMQHAPCKTHFPHTCGITGGITGATTAATHNCHPHPHPVANTQGVVTQQACHLPLCVVLNPSGAIAALQKQRLERAFTCGLHGSVLWSRAPA